MSYFDSLGEDGEISWKNRYETGKWEPPPLLLSLFFLSTDIIACEIFNKADFLIADRGSGIFQTLWDTPVDHQSTYITSPSDKQHLGI